MSNEYETSMTETNTAEYNISKGLNAGTKEFLDIRSEFETTAELGFDHVELNLEGPVEHEHWVTIQDDLTDALDALGLELTVHLPWYGLDVGNPRRPARRGAIETFKGYMDLAVTLGATKGTMHLGSSRLESPGWSRDTILETMAESVDELDAFARDRGLELCVENGGGFVTAYDAVTILDRTDVSMTFDTGHAWVSGMHPDQQAEFVAEHAARISHFHLNDARGPHDEHLPFGSGAIDFEPIFAPLVESDWTGTLLLEINNVQNKRYLELSKAELDRII